MNRKSIFTALLVCVTLCVPLSLFSQSQDFQIDKTVLVRYRGNAANVIIPEGITAIGEEAFKFCEKQITSVTIPLSVASIRVEAFSGCSNLKEIIVNEQNISFSSVDGILFNKAKTVIIKYPAGKQNSFYIIPASVTSIGYRSFSGCGNLARVTIPSTVTSIMARAFSVCTSLTSVTVPSGITSISDYSFQGCSSLASVNIPSGVTSIGDGAFWECKSLTGITIPSSVTSIKGTAFAGCSSLTSVTIPSGVTSIGTYAFSDCNFTSVTIPSSVTSMGYGIFGSNSLREIIVDEQNMSYSSMDGVLFNKEKTVLIEYPEGKRNNAYTIPASVTSIMRLAFSRCNNLTSINIPSTVTFIYGQAFSSCKNLVNVNIPSGVTTIKEYTFAYCDSLTSVIFPSTLSSIEDHSFYECTNLVSIVIPAGVTSIHDTAFQSCDSLASITIEGSINRGTISNGDFQTKYRAGGPGTYTRSRGGSTWTKQKSVTAEDLYKRGNEYFSKGDYFNAIPDYIQAIKINPDFKDVYNKLVDTYFIVGVAYVNKWEFQRASAYFETILRINPNHAEAKEKLTFARMMMNLQKMLQEENR